VIHTIFCNEQMLVLQFDRPEKQLVRAFAHLMELEYDPEIYDCKGSVIFFKRGLTNGYAKETIKEGRGDASDTRDLFDEPNA